MTWIALVVGAAVGAPLRYVVERRVSAGMQRRGVRPFPWGLLVVNGAGSAIAGVALATTTGDTRVLILTGFCGAFTTFSGFAWDADRLWRAARASFWWAMIVMPTACVTLFMLAWKLGSSAVA
jgi:CrcB protein